MNQLDGHFLFFLLMWYIILIDFCILNQQDVIDIYRIPKPAEYEFFSSWRVTLAKVDHIMDHKTHLNNLKE